MFSYQLKKTKRAKRIRLTVRSDGKVTITTPLWITGNLIERFLREKEKWIQNKIQFFKDTESKRARKFSTKDYLENKSRALTLARDRIAFYNQIYGFAFNKIFIKNQKTRWGSCSIKRNLNLNYKILFLPQKYQDYIIVHELCHLQELNHSKNFWALVKKGVPDYLNIKKELHKHHLLYKQWVVY